MSIDTGTAAQRSERAGEEEREEHYDGPWWGFPPMRNALAGGVLLATGLALSLIDAVPEAVSIGLYVAAIPLGASHWGREVLESLAKLRINIDVLMGVATVGAAVLGLWEEAATLAFLYGAAEALEEYIYDRTRSAIRALLDLAPKQARIVQDGSEVMVPAEEIAVGQTFIVRPGESLPTDGIIRKGSTSLDESPVTGESIPVERTQGNTVFAGTINLTGAVHVEATRSFQDNTLSKIIHLVEQAQEEKTTAQRFIDRFGQYYSPAVLLGALALLALPPLFGGDLRLWTTRAITLAVAGAPCALVMSTPVAVAAGIGQAGKRGVLIKGGLFLERLKGVTCVVFDKTGTLTLGRPMVTDVVSLHGEMQDAVLKQAASVEWSSEHPLAQAIVEHAQTQGLDVRAGEDFQALIGMGASAQVNGHLLYVGQPDLFTSQGVDVATALPRIAQLQSKGKTIVLVGGGQTILGVIALRDGLRPEAHKVLEQLRRNGMRRLVMLTGDTEETALAIAGQLGIEEVKSGLKPEQKTEEVRRLIAEGEKVVMVGDGINDAPALAAAHVGMAMGTAGTDAAIEAADVALMGDDLGGVVYAVKAGQRAGGIMQQNIVFSVALLAGLIPLAVLGLIGVALAVLAHEVAEVLAVANGLRARLSGRRA